MANYNFTVRPGMTVCLGAPNANGSGATVSTGGQAVSLSDAQYESHAHKVQPADSPATTKVASVANLVHTPAQNTI
jgi:hypothetical protein